MSYEITITDNAKAQLAESVLNNKVVVFEQFKISDQSNDISLNSVVYSGLVNDVQTSENEIIIRCIVPEEAGGFWLKHIVLLDEDGNVLAQGNIPEFYKANDNLSPTVSDYTIKIKYDNADQVNISFNSQACSSIDNYYQLAESLIRLMNNHNELVWRYAKDQYI
ncbi:phage tail protein [Thiotrichales bacterium 19S3-7]|nr:phage tail protein [Thiotrichales bacterium 19S3-7]MCF6802779.1 phage tail protein [Thiotrichales bacterium 19S3-11]